MERLLEHEEPLHEYARALEKLKSCKPPKDFEQEIAQMEQKLKELKRKVYSRLAPWERIQISRHPARPRSSHIIHNCFDQFVELHGDRLYRDDPAVLTGLAQINGKSCVVIAQEKGNDTETRMERNFGMGHPEGFRKAQRMMDMGEKFSLPIISIVDTPGAFPGLEAEQRGQGIAIAESIKRMASLKVPVFVLILSEGCSGGALAIGMGDHVSMCEHAYYSVISPEGCASILFKDPSKTMESAEAMRLNAEFLLEHGVIDHVITEPLGGAHSNLKKFYEDVKDHLTGKLNQMTQLSADVYDQLVQKRMHRYRNYGVFLENT